MYQVRLHHQHLAAACQSATRLRSSTWMRGALSFERNRRPSLPYCGHHWRCRMVLTDRVMFPPSARPPGRAFSLRMVARRRSPPLVKIVEPRSGDHSDRGSIPRPNSPSGARVKGGKRREPKEVHTLIQAAVHDKTRCGCRHYGHGLQVCSCSCFRGAYNGQINPAPCRKNVEKVGASGRFQLR